jgi:predicted lipid-binding transport protein (Tim44 family)
MYLIGSFIGWLVAGFLGMALVVAVVGGIAFAVIALVNLPVFIVWLCRGCPGGLAPGEPIDYTGAKIRQRDEWKAEFDALRRDPRPENAARRRELAEKIMG